MRQEKFRQILRGSGGKYLLVGIISLGVDYFTLILGYRLFDFPLGVAATTAFLLGLLTNFLLNKYWSFQAPHGKKNNLRQAILYGILVVVNTVFTNIFILYFDHIGIPPEVTKPVATAIITLWNYVLYQKVIFKRHSPTDLERSIM